MYDFNLRTNSSTVAFVGDDPIPDTIYGENVEITVSCNLDTTENALDTLVFRIGDKTFLPGEVKHWQVLIEQARKMIEAAK